MKGISLLLMSIFYIFNVSQNLFLAIDSDGKAVLNQQGSPITLSQEAADEASGSYTLATASGKLSASFASNAITADDNGSNTHWLLKPCNPAKDTYALGCRIADANATGFLYASTLGESQLAKRYAEPARSYEPGQWRLVSQAEVEAGIVTLDEQSTGYCKPVSTLMGQGARSSTQLTVRLKRKFTLGKINTLCLPFPISLQELRQELGAEAQVAEYIAFNGTQLTFRYTDHMEAGKPYLVTPTKAATHTDENGEAYYEFTGIASAQWAAGEEPIDITFGSQGKGSVTFHGAYHKTTAPESAYVYSNGNVYHLQKEQAMKGFRAYFEASPEASGAKLFTCAFTGTPTAILETKQTITSEQPSDIYNVSGQQVRQAATSTDGLPAGIYIQKGQKIIVK